MDFDLDDPLADILSGGSDDSFFDDDVLGRKRTPKKTTPLSSKKSALFNLDEDIKPKTVAKEEIKKDLDSLTKPAQLISTELNYSSNAHGDQVRTPAKTKDPDVSQNMGKEKHSILEKIDSSENIRAHKVDNTSKTMVKRKSSNSLFDDILGSSSTRTSALAKPPQTSKSQEFDIDALLGNKPITPAKPSTAPAKPPLVPTKPSNSTSKTSIQIETKQSEKLTKSVTAASKQVTSGADWLGIFDKKEEDDEKDANVDAGMPAWLVGKDSQSKPKTKDPVSVTPEKQKDTSKEIAQEHSLGTDIQNQMTKELNSVNDIMLKASTANKSIFDTGNVLLASSEDITQEGAAMYMQQQEAQLMVALQLKAQEEKLASMQLRQEESKKIQQQAAEAQQSQLAGMLARQAAHRQQMQSIIADHQERINQRIKALLTMPDLETNAMGGGGDGADPAEAPRADTPRARERTQLLQLVQTLQENHDREIDLMETSYRRQLALSEAASQQWEERVRAETERLARHHGDALERLERGWREVRARDAEAARAARELHARELADERERQAEGARTLREHHAALLENVNFLQSARHHGDELERLARGDGALHASVKLGFGTFEPCRQIRRAVQQERALVHDASGLAAALAAATAAVREGAERGGHLVDEVRTLHDDAVRDRQRALEARETQLTEMLQQLTRERDIFEKGKSEDRETVKLLENRLRQMTQSVDEEMGMIKQKRMEFEFEKATFDKQTDFAKNILKKQEEEIQMIKQDIQKEYQEKLAKIEEDKSKSQKDAAVASKERISVQNLRLELERLKADLQSQMEEVSEERSRVAQEKQQLQMEEQRMIAKSRDLDLLLKSALEKQSLADRKYSEAEFIQRKYEERVRRLQEHVISINTREKTIAKEKVALSRERLNLHNEKKHLESKQQCSLCRSIQNQQTNVYGHNFPATNIPSEGFLASKYLSMGVSRDYAATSGNADVLEQEMSNLLRREISLRDLDGNDAANEAEFRAEHNDVSQQVKYKDAVDPRLLLLKMDVKQVISHLSRATPPRTPSPTPAPAPAAVDRNPPPIEPQ